MCTCDRPAHTLSASQSSSQSQEQVMTSSQLKELHKTLTFHYNQYTQLQQLPPDQQQEKHEEMTYHYTQYSVMYRQYQEQQALKKKNKKQKVIKKPKVVDQSMQYLKLQRVFLMNEQQQNVLTNAMSLSQIQQLFGQYAHITVVAQNNCYQISIPSNIPLPRRKDHWNQILQIIQSQIGQSQEM